MFFHVSSNLEAVLAVSWKKKHEMYAVEYSFRSNQTGIV